MPYSVYIANNAKKELKKIPLPWRDRIIEVLRIIAKNPLAGIPMTGELKGKRKVRVWPYRIIYEFDKKEKIVNVLEIGHRGGMSYK
ncbi:MAG: type II toxin-antitoxin system RelE/ParE family toxin [bacterium]|nr:type II toxin-antitoxin system RelE/ParE family toxin [bacterium]